MSFPSLPLISIVRTLRARPGLFLARTLLIALLVGVGGAVAAVAYATVLAPLPFPEAGRLATLLTYAPGVTQITGATPLHPFEFVRLRDQGKFEMLEGVSLRERALGGADDPESVPTGAVSAGFIPMLGGVVQAGRGITEEDARDNARVAVLSHGLWTRRFGRDPQIVGRSILVDREPHEIIGVLPERFSPGFVVADMWTPLYVSPAEMTTGRSTTIRTFVRLRKGDSVAQATSSVRAAMPALIAEAPSILKDWNARVHPLAEFLYGQQRPGILLLLAAVGALALLSAANLANLTLADVLSRQKDFAIRTSLGASRRDLVIPEIVQGIAIGLIGGGIGLGVASVTLPALLEAGGGALDAAPIRVNWIVTLAMLTFAVLVVVITAVVPAMRLAGLQSAGLVMQSGERTSGSRESARLRRLLLVAQSAIALVLLAVTGLVIAGYARSTRIDPGFDPRNVLAAQIRLPETAYPTPAARAAAVYAIVDRVRAESGVEQAATTIWPLIPNFPFFTLMDIEGQPTPTGQPHPVGFRRISPGFFDTMKIPRIAGRSFDTSDVTTGQLVGIISQSFARRFWGDTDPIGRRMRRPAPNAPWITVVGVVGDVYDMGFGTEPMATLYVPYTQGNNAAVPVTLMVRTSAEPELFKAAVSRAVRAVDPLQPVATTMTIEKFMWISLGPQRFRSVLLTAFAGLGLLIAALGTYGVTARSVAERRREIGIRLALGGTPGAVWRSVAFATLQPVVAGAAIGGAGAWLAARALPTMLPEVQSGLDGGVAVAAALLLAVGAAATFAASARATRVEPLKAMRS